MSEIPNEQTSYWLFLLLYTQKKTICRRVKIKNHVGKSFGARDEEKIKEIRTNGENYSVAVIKNSSENISKNKRKREERWIENDLVEG